MFVLFHDQDQEQISTHLLVMPALRAFGRAWEFGSDDLVFPGFILTLIRIVWLLIQVRNATMVGINSIVERYKSTTSSYFSTNCSTCNDFVIIQY